MIRSFLVFAFTSSLALFLLPVAAQSQDRAELQFRIESLREEILAKERVFLAPSAEDLAAFAEFLRQPDTGLARLMPREKYDGSLLTPGGGAFYSFARLSNEYGAGSDIELLNGRLVTGFAGTDFGFFTELGNLPLGSVIAEHSAIRYLAELTTPSTEPEAREQQRRSGVGFDVEGFTYRGWLPASPETTYALRSVTYGSSDVLVVFKTTRQDKDGSLILAWRIMKRFPVPKLGASNLEQRLVQTTSGR